jgi:hypothetical protein
VILFVIGCLIGLRFADFDTWFRWYPVLVHRSLLTHSFFAPLLLFRAFRGHTEPAARLFVLGVCVASAVHFAFDLFPLRWHGFALVWVPFHGRISMPLSMLWLFVSAVVCLYLACLLLCRVGEFYLGLLGLTVSYGIMAAREPGIFLNALIALALAAPIAFVLPRRAVKSEGFTFRL